MSYPASMSSSWWAWPCLSLALGLISDPCRTALLVRCGLNRRPVVSRPLARRGAADPASLREGRLAVCSGQDLLARNPALLAQPDRTCEAARPLPVPVRPHRRADRHGSEPLRNKEGTDMAKPSTPNRSNARVSQSRRATTLEMVRLTCPDATQASKIATSFGTAVVDSDGIRSLHERLIVETAESLSEGLGEKAMQIHLQRIVGAFVGSAHGAGQFYSRAVTEARDATAKASNDARDEDLDGPVGYDSAAQRKREFAADMGVQSHALRMAAEGAVAAYEQVIGETWKPFDRPVENPGASLDRKAAEAQLAAFG